MPLGLGLWFRYLVLCRTHWYTLAGPTLTLLQGSAGNAHRELARAHERRVSDPDKYMLSASKRQRGLPGSDLTWQQPQARVLAPQRSRVANRQVRRRRLVAIVLPRPSAMACAARHQSPSFAGAKASYPDAESAKPDFGPDGIGPGVHDRAHSQKWIHGSYFEARWHTPLAGCWFIFSESDGGEYP